MCLWLISYLRLEGMEKGAWDKKFGINENFLRFLLVS